MSFLGYSLPASCGRIPGEDDDGVTVLQDRVSALLEEASLPTAIVDQIIHLIAKGESERYEAELAAQKQAHLATR